MAPWTYLFSTFSTDQEQPHDPRTAHSPLIAHHTTSSSARCESADMCSTICIATGVRQRGDSVTVIDLSGWFMDPMVKAAKAARACARLGSCTCPFLGPLSGGCVVSHSLRARNPRSPSFPRFVRGWGWGSHPRFAGDRGWTRPHWHPQPRFAEIRDAPPSHPGPIVPDLPGIAARGPSPSPSPICRGRAWTPVPDSRAHRGFRALALSHRSILFESISS